jgi:hypothetical protein
MHDNTILRKTRRPSNVGPFAEEKHETTFALLHPSCQHYAASAAEERLYQKVPCCESAAKRTIYFVEEGKRKNRGL